MTITTKLEAVKKPGEDNKAKAIEAKKPRPGDNEKLREPLVGHLTEIKVEVPKPKKRVINARYRRYLRGRCSIPVPTFLIETRPHAFVTGEIRQRPVSVDYRRPLDPVDQGFLVFGPSEEDMLKAKEREKLNKEGEKMGLKSVSSPRLTGETLKMKETVRPDGYLEFDYELDLDFEEFETFELPDIFLGRYVHDFKVNKTAITDDFNDRCFILDLDRDEVPEPRNIIQIINSLRDKAYDVNLEEVRHDTRVLLPPVDITSGFGKIIPQPHYCGKKTTFLLVRINNEDTTPVAMSRRKKRDTAEEDPESLNFVEFTGQKMVQYRIVNPEALKQE